MNALTTIADIHKDQADRVLARLDSLDLSTDDCVPLQTAWRRKCINLLTEQIEFHLGDRDDYYVAGNVYIYYSAAQATSRQFRGADFIFVSDTTRQPIRDSWVVWNEELRTPNVVIELSSPSTRDDDHGAKFHIYRDTLRVGNYFIYDPETKLLEGWRLDKRRYVIIRPDENGRLLSDELGLLLGKWDGEFVRDNATWLRFFQTDGAVVPVPVEAEQRHALEEKQRADLEKQRADAATAEVARLREQLAMLQATAENPS